MRVSIRVRPGASRTRVGGQHAGALVVAVGARAVDGAATEAALAALADALGVRRRHVRLVTGATSRDKVVDVEGLPDVDLADRMARLLAG
ncbi:DUF167 domain-containing protein [Cellulomonas sp.]|uniref:DUF167 domain-containing protein n=1 Tax=Cellulomonas sp. TaxID=40001 RepID=UPI00259024E1|nr:DUF167 domain-containing protein [Cellulomonas sp.]MCR6690688.1 DUF167 domain-containing protein [Cellulomonas sp.]